jgi:hypothetical protein
VAGLLWFTIKVWMFIFFFVWLRGSLPRVRYDQFMKFGWKLMIPAALAWVVAVALIRAAQVGYFGDSQWATVITVVVIAAVVIAALLLWDRRSAAAREATLEARTSPAEIDPFADGYPVPPLPGQRIVEPRTAVGAADPVSVSAGATDDDTHDHPGGHPWLRPRTARKSPAARTSRAATRPTTRRCKARMHPRPAQGGFFADPSRPWRASGSPSARCSRRSSPRSTPRRSDRRSRASTAGTSSTGMAGRSGEVHRLRAVRLGVPGRRDLRRGRGQHRGGALLPGGALRPRLPDQLPALHLLRLCIEACPTRALTMTNEYELADTTART